MPLSVRRGRGFRSGSAVVEDLPARVDETDAPALARAADLPIQVAVDDLVEVVLVRTACEDLGALRDTKRSELRLVCRLRQSRQADDDRREEQQPEPEGEDEVPPYPWSSGGVGSRRLR